MGRTSVVRHNIEVGQAKPIRQSARRLSLKKKDEVNQAVEEMREQGVIEATQSPWFLPIVLVRKKRWYESVLRGLP